MKRNFPGRLLARVLLVASLIMAGTVGIGLGAAAGDSAALSRELVQIMGMSMIVESIKVTASDQLTGPVDPALPEADTRAMEIGREMFADELMPMFDAMAGAWNLCL